MPITVGYWSIRGLGAPLRQMLMYCDTPFQCECYDLEMTTSGVNGAAWFSKKPELKAKNPLINLPYVADGDMVLAQSNACMAYLGRKLGMVDASNEARVDELLCETMDLRNSMTTFTYQTKPDAAKEAAGALCSRVAEGSLAKLEAVLEANKVSMLCLSLSGELKARIARANRLQLC